MGFPAEAFIFCTSQAPCRYEIPEAEEGERTIWLSSYLTIWPALPCLTAAPATPLRTPNIKSKHLSLHNSQGSKQEGIRGTHFRRGMCHQRILASLPAPAYVKVQRCGLAMTASGQGESTCPLPVWQWQGGRSACRGLWSDCCLLLAWLVCQQQSWAGKWAMQRELEKFGCLFRLGWPHGTGDVNLHSAAVAVGWHRASYPCLGAWQGRGWLQSELESMESWVSQYLHVLTIKCKNKMSEW